MARKKHKVIHSQWTGSPEWICGASIWFKAVALGLKISHVLLQNLFYLTLMVGDDIKVK